MDGSRPGRFSPDAAIGTVLAPKRQTRVVFGRRHSISRKGVITNQAERSSFDERGHQGRPVRSLQAGIFLLTLLLTGSAATAQPSYPPSRPVLFVVGWCGSGADWDGTLVTSGVAAHLSNENPGLYPDKTLWEIYYDLNEPTEARRAKLKTGVSLVDNVSLVDKTFSSPPRFFAITFYNSVLRTFDAISVANVSVVNKAAEIAGVIRAITRLTHIKDVLVVAHSMGGLVTRAYMENLLSSFPCSTTYDCLLSSRRNPLLDLYASDIGGLITIDTPHGGAGLAELLGGLDLHLRGCEEINARP